MTEFSIEHRMTTWTRVAALTCAVLSGASRAADKPVAVVDGVSITRDDFLRVYRSAVEKLVADGFSRQAIDLMGIHEQVLDSLIDAELLRAAGSKGDTTVSDAELKAPLVVTDQEVHDRCRKLTELASLAVVEFDERGFRSDVTPPTHERLVAWAAGHQAELDARFAHDAVNQGILFAIRRRGAWVTGDETEIREMLALELYVVSQARLLARREAEKTLASVKRGKRLDELFPDDVIHTRPFSPLDAAAGHLTMTPELADAIFRLKRPGPLGSVFSSGGSEVVATVETRQVLREAVCRSNAETWRRELRAEKQAAARSTFIKALREKAVITTDGLEVAQLKNETLHSLGVDE